ncbi:MAG: KH domain-containing protein [Ruminococcaceae bacterium]|nr:KH domain-containing protein [Oscillospiraceae bacterium]
MTNLKETLCGIAKAIVDNPDEVSVIETVNGNKVNLVLNVAEDDMGMVIGKNGKIAKAIRTVMRAAANVDGKDVIVDIR